MGRAILLLLSIMLSFSVAVGSVAHATEGVVPLENSYAIDDCADAAQSSPQSDDDGLPHFHMCHGHHVGVPLPAFVRLSAPVSESAPITVKDRTLSSIESRTPQEPPRA